MSDKKNKPPKPFLSVILPAYNRRATIPRAIESIIAQGIEKLEILVADDASIDDTATVAASIDKRVQIFRLAHNSGPAAARNLAMRNAKGAYLAFLDSDDEWLPQKIDAQIAFLEENSQVGLCAVSHFFSNGNGLIVEKIVQNPPDWRRELHSAQPFHGASTPVVPRWVLQTVGFQDESLRVLEDWDWCLRIAQQHPIHVLQKPLAKIYENRPTNPELTWACTEKFLFKHRKDFLSYGKAHARRVQSQHWENAGRNQFFHGNFAEGLQAFFRSFFLAPNRNPLLLFAIVLALVDRLLHSRFLVRLLAARSGLTHIPALEKIDSKVFYG